MSRRCVQGLRVHVNAVCARTECPVFYRTVCPCKIGLSVQVSAECIRTECPVDKEAILRIWLLSYCGWISLDCAVSGSQVPWRWDCVSIRSGESVDAFILWRPCGIGSLPLALGLWFRECMLWTTDTLEEELNSYIAAG